MTKRWETSTPTHCYGSKVGRSAAHSSSNSGGAQSQAARSLKTDNARMNIGELPEAPTAFTALMDSQITNHNL